MLPNPKKVADAIRNTLMRSPEERRQEAENSRNVQIRMAKTRIRRHISQQNDMVLRLTALAKNALKIGDEAHFKQVGKQLLWTRQDIRRWEKYMLTLELLEARRDQARASVDMLQAVKAISESISEMAGPQNVAQMKGDLDQAMTKASSLNERMEIMMEMMDTTIGVDVQVDDQRLNELEDTLVESISEEEAASFDEQIQDGIARIRKELEEDRK